jgi:signal transduction histidine kinase
MPVQTVERPVVARARPASRRPLASGDLHARVALALNSTLELREVLRLLAEITLEATGADRCSVFLLQGDILQPAVAIGVQPQDELWTAFREMKPVDLRTISKGLEQLAAGHAVAVEDAASSNLIPTDWVERFALRSVALVPLLAGGQPCGLMAVDYRRRRRFTHEDLMLLEAIGSYAGVAVRNARLYETTKRRARLQEALSRGMAALASPLDTERIVDHLVDAYIDLLGARLSAIGLIDPNGCNIATMAARGTHRMQGPMSISDIPEHIVSRLAKEWTTASRPVEFADDPWFGEAVGGRDAGACWYLLLPLVVEGNPRGVVLLGFDAAMTLDHEELSSAEALAAVAAVALERTALLDRLAWQVGQLDVLYRLNVALADGGDATTLVAGLNELLARHSMTVVGVAFRDRSIARRLGGDAPTRSERLLWSGASKGSSVVLSDGSLAFLMRLGHHVVGTLRVRPADLTEEKRAFLEMLAREVASVASRAALRSAVDEANRDRAVVGERDRLASDLHDTVGQLFVAIGLLSRRQVEELPHDSPWAARIARLAELADRGKWEISQTVRALAFVPAARRGLARSLKDLANSLEADSGIQVLVEMNGKFSRPSPRLDRALYRVAHQALINAWRHAHCTAVRVEVSVEKSEVVLRVLDDGVGLGQRWQEEGPGVGVAGMRRAVDEVGGTLRVRNAAPRGVLVEARVPRENR